MIVLNDTYYFIIKLYFPCFTESSNASSPSTPPEICTSSLPLTPTPSPVSSHFVAAFDVDQQTESNHDTALTLAAAGGHDELVRLLLAKNADIEHRDKKGMLHLFLFHVCLCMFFVIKAFPKISSY